MIQIIPRINHGGLWGGSPMYYGVNNGEGSTALSSSFGPTYARHPVSVAGTFRHLVIGCNQAHPTLTVTLLVNGVATALAATLDTADALAVETAQTVEVAAGDDVSYQIAGSSVASPGLVHHSTCVEFTGAACSYGLTPAAGAPAADTGWSGGALGNGFFEVTSGPALSTSYSICAAAGALTRLDAIAYSGAPGASSWEAAIVLNGVPQDGTSGTVDTRCTITGAATAATATFSLPLAVTDHVDVLLLRRGSAAPFAVAHVACSVAWEPAVASTFLLCGGSNDAIRDASPDWKWTRGDQLVATEALAEAPIGPVGLHAIGLYVERYAGPPTVGRRTVYTLRRSGVDTAITVTIADTATTGQMTGGPVAFSYGDAITLQADPINAPIQNGFKWGLALQVPTAEPPRYEVETRYIRRLRRAPHVTNEHARVFYRRFELDLERGQGLVTGQGSDPMVLLRLSRDGGQTWSEEVRMPAGQLGVYTQRCLARRLGQARDTVFEVTVSDPIAWSLVGAWLDLEPGAH